MFSLVLLRLLVFSSFVSPQTLYPESVFKNVFILTGQSNMEGQGGVINNTIWDGIVPPECRPNPRILWLSYALMWEEAHEPLHRDINSTKICGMGPEMAFSNSVLEMDTGTGVIGLVSCAVGGTKISEWRRGDTLYNQLVTRAQAALRGGAIIRAILWYQGESDTSHFEDAIQYNKSLIEFITNVTSDLRSPLIAFIQVALASGWQFVDIVRKAQLEIDPPNVRCVYAKGLPLQLDDMHLTTTTQVQLGKMLADAFLQIYY